MKKRLSFVLLTLSIFSLNISSVKALNLTQTIEITTEKKDSNVINDGKWCVAIPYMGLFCWDL